MRTLLTILALSTLTTGCFELEDIKSTDSATDTATDTGGDDSEVPAGTAQIRFVNLNRTVTFRVDGQDGVAVAQQEVTELGGTAYEEVPAGTYNLVTNDADGDNLQVEGQELVDGGRYSVALTRGGDVIVTENDEEGLDPAETRITYVNAQYESNAAGYLYYYDEASAAWSGPGRIFSLASNESFTDDFAFTTTAAKLEVLFDGLDDLLVAYNTSAYMQIAQGTSVNVYVWTEGDCTFDSTSCSPMILGQMADGSTASVEFIGSPGYGWGE